MKYILGVDGGNTKTDYFLYDVSGNFISYIRSGTCSHECLNDSYSGSYKIMKENIDYLLKKNNISMQDIVAGAFGLAGLDVPKQKNELEKVIQKLNFDKFVVDNDGYLGIKAGASKGIGVCCINGTGTVVTGINENGYRLQVGGIGYVTGDEAGGGGITREIFRRVYESLYRCGDTTELVKPIMDLLSINDPYYYMEKISELYSKKFSQTPFVTVLFEKAENGDKVSLEILDKTALGMAKSTVGCIKHLNFNSKVEIIMAGSVWIKPNSNILIDRFKFHSNNLSNLELDFILLKEPPCVGAVLWALELANNKVVSLETKNKIIENIKELNIN